MVQCMEKTALLMSSNCEGCKELKELLTKNGTIDNYKLIDISSEAGKELVKELGLKTVPSCVVIKKTPSGDEARVCSSKEFLDVLKG